MAGLRAHKSWVFCACAYIREEKQRKHKLFGVDFPRTFLTLTPGCPGVKKCFPPTRAAGKRTFWCGRPRFSAWTSMTLRFVEKLLPKKVCVDFSGPSTGLPVRLFLGTTTRILKVAKGLRFHPTLITSNNETCAFASGYMPEIDMS